MVRKSKVPRIEGGNVAELLEFYSDTSGAQICLVKTYQALVTVCEAQKP